MVTGRRGSGCRYAQTLFDVGSVGGMTDGELLGQFAAGGGGSAELAFTALVERHGPMVLRVCRSILADEQDAEDALQATFLVLVRRARSVRLRDSVASWLHGVALRVSGCARVTAARRRRHERRAAGLVSEEFLEDGRDPDLAPAIHEELDRLPERFRAVIVLCYLEGLGCEAAAARLGLPVGTIKSRLARGRERLRGRLVRRGLARLGRSPRDAAVGGVRQGSVARRGRAIHGPHRDGPGRRRSGKPRGRPGIGVRDRPENPHGHVIGPIRESGGARGGPWRASISILAMAQRSGVGPPRVKAQGAARAQAPRQAEDPMRVRPEPVLEKAQQSAEQIQKPWMKAKALAEIAAFQARRGPGRSLTGDIRAGVRDDRGDG